MATLGGSGKKFTMADSQIILKPAKDSINQTRDSSLVNAAKEIKKALVASGNSGVEPKVVWKERVVKIGDVEAFTQSSNELTGRFLDPYQGLKLP